ncbi:hypothetical protein ILUMI_00469 [Ignelater luminosus]|uniref:Uncharacterized protein n=1 Tax=Ignelater luminosus TaxID=2038154 RepID=A0A8K0DLT5_IGNLU|nr:hypothetical protein ILUMI_00469 [Ignelater luminosus]
MYFVIHDGETERYKNLIRHLDSKGLSTRNHGLAGKSANHETHVTPELRERIVKFIKAFADQVAVPLPGIIHYFTFIGEKVFCKQFVNSEEEEFHLQISSPPHGNLPPGIQPAGLSLERQSQRMSKYLANAGRGNGNNELDDISVEYENTVSLPTASGSRRKSKTVIQPRSWTTGNLANSVCELWREGFLPSTTFSASSRPLNFFLLRSDDNIIDKFIRETVAYAGFKNRRLTLCKGRLYSEEADDINNKVVSNSKKRNKFEK